ncbi:MAG: ATP synthase F1 subunit epsilon [Myxococcota bacterium]
MMQLSVVTPMGSKVDTTITQVTVPGELGDMGILPGHRALLSSLGVGTLSYTSEGRVSYLAVSGGYVEVDDGGVIVVTETAEAPEDIDVERAKASLARSQEESAGLAADAVSEQARIAASIRRANNRIEVAKHNKTSI